MSSSSERIRCGVGGAQRHPRQPLAAGDAEQIRHRDQHPGLGQHGMDLRLESGSDRDQLGSVAHQLPQLAGLRWGDPRLGQSAHPQQIGQIGGVADIVFHPPVPKPLDPQRMRQMHVALRRLQHVDRPVVG